MAHPKVWWVGAGISADCPTCAPTASQLAEQLAKALLKLVRTMPSTVAAQRFLHRKRSHWIRVLSMRSSAVTGAQTVAFEQLVGVLQEQLDKDLALLTLAFDNLEPNANHTFLAQRLAAGDLVITTNFDSCIERAFNEGFPGRKLTVAFRPEQIVRALQPNILSDATLIKLHGSLRDPNGGAAMDSVQGTVKAILRAAQRGRLGISQPVGRALEATLRNAHVVFAGYSGSDKMDITPTWRKWRSDSTWTWLVHPRFCGEKLKIDALLRELKRLKCISPKCRTRVGTLAGIGKFEVAPSGSRKQSDIDYLSWVKEQELVDIAPLLVLANLLIEAGLPRDASDLMANFESAIDDADLRTKCVFYKTLGRAASESSDLPRLRRASERLVVSAKQAGLPQELSAAYQHLAVHRLELGGLLEALAFVNRSLRISRRTAESEPIGFGHDLNLKASILSEMGRSRLAALTYVQAIEVYERAEDGEAYRMALNNLSLLAESSGRLLTLLLSKRPSLAAELQGSDETLSQVIRPQERYRIETTSVARRPLEAHDADVQGRALVRWNPALYADRLCNLAQSAIQRGSYGDGERLLRRAYLQYRHVGALGGMVRCWHVLAIIAYDRGQMRSCLYYLRRGREGIEAGYVNGSMLGSLWQMQALVHLCKGEWHEALDALGKAERLKRLAMEDSELLVISYTRAQVLTGMGREARARRGYLMLRSQYEKLGDINGLADVHLQLGNMDLKAGRTSKAYDKFSAALNQYQVCELPLGEWRARFNKAYAATLLKRFDEARALLRLCVKSRVEGLDDGERLKASQVLEAVGGLIRKQKQEVLARTSP